MQGTPPPPSESPNAPPGLSGLGLMMRALAAGVVLLTGGLIFGALFSAQTPFQVFSDRFTLLLPAQTFDIILGRLQYWGKPLLLISLSLAWLILGAALAAACGAAAHKALAGLAPPSAAARRRAEACVVTAAALPWLTGGFLIAPLSDAGVMGSDTFAGPIRFGLAALSASIAYGLALYRAFVYPFTEGAAQPADASAGLARRDFVLMGGTAVLGAVGGYVLSRDVADMLANARGGKSGSSDGNEDPDAEVTPASRFYVVSKNFSDPDVNPYDWRLKVDGLVERPLTLTLETIKALPSVQQYVTLECISNEVGGDLIGNGQWTGIRVADLLRQAGVKQTAGFFITEAEDGYYESMPLSEAMQEQVLLVYELNGQPLTYKHGFPLRLLYPGHYGMKSTKWITHINVAGQDADGYWTERGWDKTAVVRTMSKINYPEPYMDIPQGDVRIAGVAFAGARGISAVEVSVDDQQTWRPADVQPALGRYTWQLWSFAWTSPSPGRHRIAVRAVDGEGTPQDLAIAGTFPKGAAGYHSIPIRVI